MLRELLEQTTRRTVFRRRLPAAFGGASVHVSASAGLRYLFRKMDSVDPGLFRLTREFVRSDDVVWDIGANVGLFSFCAAHVAGPCGQIFAFEPDTWLVQLLRRSANTQPVESAPVQVIPAAIAQSCDLRVFNIASRSRAASFLSGYGSTQTGGIREQHMVVALSLDWLTERLPPPDIVKIDVEGAEHEVIKGAAQLLTQHKPRILCEVSSERAVEVTALLKHIGYRIYDGEALHGRRTELELAPWSTIALAAEHGSAS